MDYEEKQYALGKEPANYPVPAPAYFYNGTGWHIERLMLWCGEVTKAYQKYWLIQPTGGWDDKV